MNKKEINNLRNKIRQKPEFSKMIKYLEMNGRTITTDQYLLDNVNVLETLKVDGVIKITRSQFQQNEDRFVELTIPGKNIASQIFDWKIKMVNDYPIFEKRDLLEGLSKLQTIVLR